MLNECVTDVKAITTCVDDLETKMARLNQNDCTQTFSMAECLGEWEDRFIRKSNLMIFGVGDQHDSNDVNNDAITAVSVVPCYLS